MSTMIDAAELFQQAEEFRVQGPAAAAVQLYWAVSRRADGELKIYAEHMLGVTYSMLGRPAEANAVLEELLDSGQVEIGSARRGHILRDQAMAMNDLDDIGSAIATVAEAISIFRDIAPEDGGGLAMSLGYMSRFLANYGEEEKAGKVATEAGIMFVEVNNPPARFYHNCWCAELLVYRDKPERARSLAERLLAKQELYVNDRHRARLGLIIEHADDPNGLRAALEELKRS